MVKCSPGKLSYRGTMRSRRNREYILYTVGIFVFIFLKKIIQGQRNFLSTDASSGGGKSGRGFDGVS